MAGEGSGGGGGICCVRVSLIVFNFITVLAGAATLGIGLWLFQQSHGSNTNGTDILTDISTLDSIPNHGEFRSFSILLMSLGGLVAFVSFIGCFGACIKSRCLLLSYLTTVVLILTLQLLVAVFAFVYRHPMANSLHDELLANLKQEYNAAPGRSNWDLVQEEFHCCGVDGYTDWFKAKAWPGNDYVPQSCCVGPQNNITDCGRNGDSSIWYKQSCLNQIQLWIMEELHVLASAVITLVFLQLYGIIASTLLFYHSKTPKPKSPQYKAYLYERARM